MSSDDRKRLLTTSELAEILRVSPRTANRWAQDGTIPTAAQSRSGRVRRFVLDEVLAALRPDEVRSN